MICEKCKIRPASIFYTEVVGGKETTHALCTECAKELDFGPYSALFDGDSPLSKMLSNLLGLAGENGDKETLAADVVCPNCGINYSEFVKNSRFGCAGCYHAFDLLIGERMKKLQENSTHTGKHPKMKAGTQSNVKVDESGEVKLSFEEQLRQLENRREEALIVEDYEQAAIIRDEIKRVKEAYSHEVV